MYAFCGGTHLGLHPDAGAHMPATSTLDLAPSGPVLQPAHDHGHLADQAAASASPATGFDRAVDGRSGGVHADMPMYLAVLAALLALLLPAALPIRRTRAVAAALWVRPGMSSRRPPRLPLTRLCVLRT